MNYPGFLSSEINILDVFVKNNRKFIIVSFISASLLAQALKGLRIYRPYGTWVQGWRVSIDMEFLRD